MTQEERKWKNKAELWTESDTLSLSPRFAPRISDDSGVADDDNDTFFHYLNLTDLFLDGEFLDLCLLKSGSEGFII